MFKLASPTNNICKLYKNLSTNSGQENREICSWRLGGYSFPHKAKSFEMLATNKIKQMEERHYLDIIESAKYDSAASN